jgi:hypothetical protein
VDGTAAKDDAQHVADGEVVWSWRPDAGAKFFCANKFAREMTVAKEPGHRGELEVSRKTIAQGKPE